MYAECKTVIEIYVRERESMSSKGLGTPQPERTRLKYHHNRSFNVKIFLWQILSKLYNEQNEY